MKPTPTALGVTREIEGDRRADPRLRWRTCTQSGTLERVQAHAFEGQAGSKAASSARIRSARRSHFPGVAVVQLVAAGTDRAGAGVFSEVLMPAPKQGGAARTRVLVRASRESNLFGLERDVAVDFGQAFYARLEPFDIDSRYWRCPLPCFDWIVNHFGVLRARR